MPWTTGDVDSHKKGLTVKQKKRWVTIANAALRDCMSAKNDESKCAQSAIRIANSQVGKSSEKSK